MDPAGRLLTRLTRLEVGEHFTGQVVRLPTRQTPSVAAVLIMDPAGRLLKPPTLSAEEEPLMVLAEQRLTPRIRLEEVEPLVDEVSLGAPHRHLK